MAAGDLESGFTNLAAMGVTTRRTEVSSTSSSEGSADFEAPYWDPKRTEKYVIGSNGLPKRAHPTTGQKARKCLGILAMVVVIAAVAGVMIVTFRGKHKLFPQHTESEPEMTSSDMGSGEDDTVSKITTSSTLLPRDQPDDTWNNKQT